MSVIYGDHVAPSVRQAHGTVEGMAPVTVLAPVEASTKLTCEDCGVRVYRTSKTRRAFTCHRCKAILCAAHTFYNADESNAAITRSAFPHCETCHELLYPRPGRYQG